MNRDKKKLGIYTQHSVCSSSNRVCGLYALVYIQFVKKNQNKMDKIDISFSLYFIAESWSSLACRCR